ncbi:MAG: glycosyltransferase family 2 protein [Cyanobacteriota bacterium]|nr:glycosyltransferase family 2 protein [Cyanobacteriota bacterium]
MLSLSMIVRNEASHIGACLASVQGFVDEIVVLDTGSDDNTAAIAQGCGAQVHHAPWPGDFAPARNQALDLVRGDWVLVLDADEQLLSQARDPLRRLMADPDLLLITLLRHERGAVQSPYSNVSRLFRRLEGIAWSGRYHALVDRSVAARMAHEPRWRVGHCPIPALVHDGYRPELLADGTKARRLRAAMEADRALRPTDPYLCAKLGALDVREGQRQRGLRLLELGLRHCPAEAHAERYELLLHQAIARATSHPEAATALYRQALALPLDGRLTLAARLNLAALLLDQGELEEAAALAEQATVLAPEVGLGWYSLGLVRRRRGQLVAAIAAYRRAITQSPDHAEAHQNLAAALLLAGDIEGARQGFGRAIQLLNQQGRVQEARQLRQRAGAMVHLEHP